MSDDDSAWTLFLRMWLVGIVVCGILYAFAIGAVRIHLPTSTHEWLLLGAVSVGGGLILGLLGFLGDRF